ncbi:MAG: amidohydrolase family protein [Candidatus Thorarchaeota archaeon]|nr:MAG: amidohydrolase family protein [Candidatus Thorarchaeota archaeon]
MLVVRAVDDIPESGIKADSEFKIYLVDAHHHMGREKGHRNTPSGAYDFYAMLWLEIQKMASAMLEDDELAFEPVGVVPPDFASRFFSARESWEQMNHGWLVDRTVVFPYSDDYSKAGPEDRASFSLSNERISGWSTRAPHSTRLIGFCRVDPHDSKKTPHMAINELNRSVNTLGLRGLKLHPLAQLFLDEIEDEITVGLVRRASDLGVTVIFDTRSMRTVDKIANIIERIEGSSKKKRNKPKVVLAHCGMSPGDPQLHEVLSNPSVYGEISSLHGRDLPLLFESASEMIAQEGVHWSEKILFGTDYSFLSFQAAEAILFLLSRDFPGSLEDVRRILGLNSLKLTQTPFYTNRATDRRPVLVSLPDPTSTDFNRLLEIVVSLASSDMWEIRSTDLLHVPGESSEVRAGGKDKGSETKSYVIALQSKSNDEEIHIWVRHDSDKVLSFALLESVPLHSTLLADGWGLDLDAKLLRAHAKYSEVLKDFDEFTRRLSKTLV